MKYSIYLHIPYCRSRCRYCAFYTAPASGAVPEEFIEALLRDIKALAPRQKNGASEQPYSVYFGGGTPSLLTPQQVRRLLQACNPLPEAEVTLEVNPEHGQREKLAAYYQAGVNRISFGVQTADAESLRRLGRLHTPQQAKESLANARAAGFSNITGDIMLALPSYSNKEFDETFFLLEDGGVTHISAYILKVEEGTAFARQNRQDLPSEDEAAEFYTYASQQLAKAGFERYEISNFAKEGYRGQHNMMYWNCENYLGLGPSAHSCMEGRRFSQMADTDTYIQQIPAIIEEGTLDVEDYIMLRLRLQDGLSELQLQKRFSYTLNEKKKGLFAKLEAHRLAEFLNGTWRLTTSGLLVENRILVELLSM